ncbi:carbohydrate ABC transporter permease [Microbacterium sp. A82]|uniref:carbohydrate ABC transporter permease n=1 Tax=unclassified Microbacterium TaxID=2609290 RepID=UPI003F2EB003
MSATAAPITRPGRSKRPPAALWLLLLPFMIMFAAFFIAPIVYAIIDSLFTQKSSGLGLTAPTREFVFLDNYLSALSTPSFVASLGRLVAFAAIEVPLMVVTALALALLLGAGAARFPRVFRVTYFMPYGVPGVIAALLWGFLYMPATSPVLQLLSKFGIDLSPLSSDAVLFAIANIALWAFAGYNMLILIAALDAIPSELYEAARLDGASEWHMIWHIKLPLIRPSVVLITLFTIIGTLQLFVEPLVLRPLTTAISSDFAPNLAAYNQAFSQGNPNLAAAMAVIVALLAFAFSAIFIRVVNRKGNRAW